MIDIKKSCEYIYNSVHLPVYLYSNTMELITCFPYQDACTHPLHEYLAQLWHSTDLISYIETDHYTYYGCVQVINREFRIVLGPANPLPYTKRTLTSMQEYFMIENSKTEIFNLFFCTIPPQDIDTFISILLLTNSLINHTQLTKSDVTHYSSTIPDGYITEDYYKNTEIYFEEKMYGFNYEIEKELFHYIESGNVNKLQEFYESTAYRNYETGITNNNYLRQKKNGFIIGIALTSRSAIRGGLPPITAYQLSENYIKQMEQLAEIIAIDSLLVRATYDFTRRTANSKIPSNIDKFLYKIIKYVNENIYKSITVSDIAFSMHFNRSYLSHKFKTQFGMELGKYILSLKLEEGKNLLKYTNKSISQISNLLSFSSQSHFQNAFKRQYKVTPQAYRNSKSL